MAFFANFKKSALELKNLPLQLGGLSLGPVGLV